jgi:hypothetical protein
VKTIQDDNFDHVAAEQVGMIVCRRCDEVEMFWVKDWFDGYISFLSCAGLLAD